MLGGSGSQPEDGWLDSVRQSAVALAAELTPLRALDAAVKAALQRVDCPLQGAQLTFKIDGSGRFAERSVGTPGAGGGEILEERLGSNCVYRLTVWPKPRRDVRTTKPAFLELANSFWKPQLRDDKSHLQSVLIPSGAQLLEHTLRRYVDLRQQAFFFFCDLDRFKAINDAHGQVEGDRVILELATVLDEAVQPNAIAMHRSGDEFFILYHAAHPEDALRLAYDVHRAVTSHDFRVSVPVSLSAGIASLRDLPNPTSLVEIRPVLERQAEKALKPAAGEKQRGTARLVGSTQPKALPSQTKATQDRAKCLVKSAIADPRPFDNSWLNLIASTVRDAAAQEENLQVRLDHILAWIQVDWLPDTLSTSRALSPSTDPRAAFGPVDAALAATHGVWRARLDAEHDDGTSLQIEWSSASSRTSLVSLPGNGIVATIPRSGSDDGRLELGGLVRRAAGNPTKNLQRALLIQIGRVLLDVPGSMFAAVIPMDDRPYQEGGLPDLWEATLAAVFSALAGNPNIAAVYVLGNKSSAPETVKRLQDLDEVLRDITRTSHKTGTSESTIRQAIERLRTGRGRVHTVADQDELFAHLATLLDPPYVVEPTQEPVPSRGNRFLRREVSLDDVRLAQTDGCRVATIAEAFPTVVAIVTGASLPASRDQFGRQSKELIDFTVRLHRAERDQVPSFYSDERDSLDQYFERQFRAANGAFYDRLVSDERIDRLAEHLVEMVDGDGGVVGTRRAILTADTAPGAEPLATSQLMSVRVFPREVDGRVAMRFGLTWRSMELLVGFPYTLYGSVRLSQYILSKVKHAVSDQVARKLVLDEVTYTACSLHFFVGKYWDDIARRIIDDASL
jgi:diguanylate cyclase (GGDEF)-like protein